MSAAWRAFAYSASVLSSELIKPDGIEEAVVC